MSKDPKVSKIKFIVDNYGKMFKKHKAKKKEPMRKLMYSESMT